MIKLKIFILLLFLTNFAFGQSPYQLDWKKEVSLSGSGAITLASSFFINANTEAFNVDELALLDRNDIPSFERFVSFNYSNKAHQLSNVFLLSSPILPGLLFLRKQPRNHFGQMAVLYGEAVLLTGGITNLAKTSFLRSRPLLYNENVNLIDKQKISNRHSFFSGHTSLTAMNYFFAAKVFSDFYPDSSWKPYIWGLAITVPALTGALRVSAGKHFVSDVVVGYGVGALIGYMVPHLHKTKKEKRLSFVPLANGIYISWKME